MHLSSNQPVTVTCARTIEGALAEFVRLGINKHTIVELTEAALQAVRAVVDGQAIPRRDLQALTRELWREVHRVPGLPPGVRPRVYAIRQACLEKLRKLPDADPTESARPDPAASGEAHPRGGRAARMVPLPEAPTTASPVPHLTSLYSTLERGPYGSARYPGNCSGLLIKDLLEFFAPGSVFDPMTGSGTCRDVCRELEIPCQSSDLTGGVDACDPRLYEGLGPFDFVWLHPPYWRQKVYNRDPRCLSNAPTLKEFLGRLQQLVRNCAGVLSERGKLAILIGGYNDREAGFVPLVYHTQQIAFAEGMEQACTEIVRFQHGNSSSRKAYRSSFIPNLHDVCLVFRRGQHGRSGRGSHG